MRVAIIGAQSVGKTTILEALKLKEEFNGFIFLEEIVRNILKEGYKINEEGDEDTQLRVLNAHLTNIYSYNNKNTITDRCIIDCFCYTKYLYENNKILSDTYMAIRNILKILINKYDIIFYIKPEFDLVEDKVRSSNIEFRDRMAQIFEETIETFHIKVIELHGSVEERVNKVVEEVEKFRNINEFSSRN